MSFRGRSALVVLGLGLEGWALLSLNPLPGADLSRHVTLFLTAWACYVGAIAIVVRTSEGTGDRGQGTGIRAHADLPDPRPPTPDPRLSLPSDLVLIFLIGALLRATFLTTSPSLSDDVFRSVWDARLIWHGVNPYLYPPGAPELAAFRDDAIWARVNAKEQRTPYLPLTEELGAVTYLLLPERTLAFQAAAAGMDLMAAGLMAWLLARLGQDPRRALVLAWSPAGVLQFAHSGHNDAALVLAMVVAALLLSYQRRLGAMLALSAAAMVKAVPILAVLVFGRLLGWWRIGPAVALSVATALPFLSAAPVLLSGLVEEGSESQFNDSFHWLVERAAHLVVPDHASAAASALGALVLLIAMVVVATRARPHPNPLPEGEGASLVPLPLGEAGQGRAATAGRVRAAQSAQRSAHALIASCQLMGLYLMVAPVVQPWYFTWLAPLIALSLVPGKGALPFGASSAVAWLWLGGTSILTDLSYLPGGTDLWPITRAVEYGPFYALFAWAAFRAWQRRARLVPSPPAGEG